MKISIMVSTPQPPPRKTPTPEQKIRSIVEAVEQGTASVVEWNLLCRMYKALGQSCQTPRAVSLRKMIGPVLRKHGYYGRLED
jgi:hypothetical protein